MTAKRAMNCDDKIYYFFVNLKSLIDLTLNMIGTFLICFLVDDNYSTDADWAENDRFYTYALHFLATHFHKKLLQFSFLLLHEKKILHHAAHCCRFLLFFSWRAQTCSNIYCNRRNSKIISLLNFTHVSAEIRWRQSCGKRKSVGLGKFLRFNVLVN